MSVAFFNPTAGYGLFEETRGGFCDVAVAETSDGGTAFSAPVQVAPCNRFGSTATVHLAFDDHGDGFLYGTTLFETHDGGASWQPDPQRGPVLSVEALGNSIWMLEADCAQRANPASSVLCPLQVYESTDGGRTWTQSPALPPTAVASLTGRVGIEGERRQGSLVRAGMTSAYVVGSPPTTQQTLVSSVPGTVPLYVTTDGGHTWVQRSIPCGTDNQQAALSAASTGTLVAVCGRYTGLTGHVEEKAVLTSADGGANWSEKTTCDPISGVYCALANGYLSDLDAVTASNFYVIGVGGFLVETTDGGVEWSTLPVADGSGGGNPSVVFFNPSDGLVVTQTSFWRTANAGLNWSKVTPFVHQVSPPAQSVDHLDTATLPAPIRTAARAIENKTSVPFEAPFILPPSLSAKATVSRTGYSVSLYECPGQLRFDTPAIGEGDCAGSAHEFGSFSGEQEASASTARAVMRKVVSTPPGCPTGRNLVRRRIHNITAVQEDAAGTRPDCAFTWRLGQWTVEISGDVTSSYASQAAEIVGSEFPSKLALPKASGVLVINSTASTYHVRAQWSQGSTVYEVKIPTAYPDTSAELPLISAMAPVAKL